MTERQPQKIWLLWSQGYDIGSGAVGLKCRFGSIH